MVNVMIDAKDLAVTARFFSCFISAAEAPPLCEQRGVMITSVLACEPFPTYQPLKLSFS